MKTTIIINGTSCLVLTPENDLEKQFLKELNGGDAKTISSGNTILQNNVEGGLIITKSKDKDKKEPER